MNNVEFQRIDQPETQVYAEYIEHAINLAHAGRVSEAVVEMQLQILEHPGCHLLNYWLGIFLYDLGEYESACEAFERELEVTPRWCAAAWELGSAYSRLDLRDKAIEAYQRAIDIDPCCVQALYGLGNAYRRGGDYYEAIEYYEDALFLRPELDRPDRRIDEKQVESLTAIIYFNLGTTWMVAGNSEKAKEAFANVQRIQPGGRLAGFAEKNLQQLSIVGDKLDPTSWMITELSPEEI